VRRFLLWLAALIPAGLGLALNLWFAGGDSDPYIRARAPLSTWLFLIGLTLSIIAMSGLAVWGLVEQRHGRALTQAHTRALADRRRFLQRLDHELKNPLTAIRAGLANARDGASPETLESVDAQAQRISRLTADLRKLAELETRPLERSAVDVNDLLTQVVELAQDRPEIEHRHFTLTLPQAPWPLPHVSGDRDLLFLLAHNLLDNAIKFTRRGDTLEVRAFEDGASVVIEVADTGPGIPADDLPHVWEELYRGQSARGVPGSGLGLALAQAIVQRHGGQITLRSRAGRGTVFTVRLPIKG
jgi:two-component system OmpR family sensor kinase